MIIVRTPFRISFFGGGTDLPAWYKKNGGAVLSTTIDKYCYISCRRLPAFFEYRHRIVYSKQETVAGIDEIVHPAVREALRYADVEDGLEIHHDGDLPARSGLGASSAFTVGLLQTLYALKGKIVTKKTLALDAIHVEQDMIKENVGSQDQVAVAYGGFNKILFNGDNDIHVAPVIIGQQRLDRFRSHLMLFFTGLTRFASEIECEKIERMERNGRELKRMQEMVDEAVEILNGDGDISDFGRMLDEGWRLKKRLSARVSTQAIDTVYERAMRNGAAGGKILGAGGGGFILFFVKPEERERLRCALSDLLYVPFRFDTSGSQIIFYGEGEQ